VNIKILICQIIGPAATGSAGPVPTPMLNKTQCDDAAFVSMELSAVADLNHGMMAA